MGSDIRRRSTLQVYIPAELRLTLRRRALDLEVTASELARRALTEYLQRVVSDPPTRRDREAAS